MSILKPNTGGVIARCSLTTSLLVAILALAFSGITQAADTHGAGIGVVCTPNVRTCTDNDSCSDNNACTEDTCSTTYPTTMTCTYSVENRDDFGDTLTVTDAWAIVEAFAGDVRDPNPGPPVITAFFGDVTNCALGALPASAPYCQLGPGSAIPEVDAGEIEFELTYDVQPGDFDLPGHVLFTEGNATGTDDCDNSPCAPGGPWRASFTTNTTIETGCSSGSLHDCSALDDLCGTYECDPLGSTQNNCDTPIPASATTTCRPSAGICDVAESCDGVNSACPGDAKVSATTECRASGGVCDVAESCDGTNDACPGDAKVSATTECRASGGVCDVAESCDGTNDACPGDAKVSATTECRASAGECDVAESCDGTTDNCPADGFQPPGTICTDDGNDDCFEPLCDDAGNCTQDNEIIPPPDFCVDDEICRTPGYWKTHAGTEKGSRPPGNVTQAVIDGAGGSLDVCGFQITNTTVFPEAGWEESALEAMCVSVKGDKQRQLIRQLTAAALNCELSGGATASCSQYHQDMIFDCNAICDANSDSQAMNDCIGAIDDFNNGLDAGGTCNVSGDFCMDVGDCTNLEDTRCDPNDNCHDRSLCEDDSDYCFEGGPAGSTGACKAASKNDAYLPASP